jgi:hypothetical protein
MDAGEERAWAQDTFSAGAIVDLDEGEACNGYER